MGELRLRTESGRNTGSLNQWTSWICHLPKLTLDLEIGSSRNEHGADITKVADESVIATQVYILRHPYIIRSVRKKDKECNLYDVTCGYICWKPCNCLYIYKRLLARLPSSCHFACGHVACNITHMRNVMKLMNSVIIHHKMSQQLWSTLNSSSHSCMGR